MKDSLRPGASRTSRITIDRERTIGFMGEEGRVYATPRMVRDVEHTCRDLILEHADTNEDSVGIEVSIRHLAPTLPDMTVEITATVRAVEGRKVSFDFEVKDNLEPVGAGTHSRFVVDKTKTLERLKAKAVKFAALR
jgi:fluoroacetyl-CoA thioesterase